LPAAAGRRLHPPPWNLKFEIDDVWKTDCAEDRVAGRESAQSDGILGQAAF